MGVETALMAGSLASTAITTGMSFIDAGNQRAKQRQAEKAAEKAMAEARKRLAVNFTDELAIRKEPYELQREALLSQGAMAIQAGVESERGAAPTAGKIQMAQNEAQAGIRTEMGKEMMDIDKQRIEEASRLRDLNVQLDLGQVEGAQLAAQNAEEAATAATAQGIEGVTSLVGQGISMIPLFAKSNGNDFNNKSVMPDSLKIQSFDMKPQVSNIPNQFPRRQGIDPYMGYYSDFTGSDYGKFGTNFSSVGGF
jgi:hypothetical protein